MRPPFRTDRDILQPQVIPELRQLLSNLREQRSHTPSFTCTRQQTSIHTKADFQHRYVMTAQDTIDWSPVSSPRSTESGILGSVRRTISFTLANWNTTPVRGTAQTVGGACKQCGERLLRPVGTSLGVILLAVLLLGWSLGCGGDDRGPQLTPTEAWQLALSQSQKPELSAGYEDWLRIDPSSPQGLQARARLDSADSQYHQALRLLQSGQPGARDALLRGKAIAPMDPRLFLPLARALRTQENDYLAVQFYRSFLRHRPTDTESALARRELAQIETEMSSLAADPEDSTSGAIERDQRALIRRIWGWKGQPLLWIGVGFGILMGVGFGVRRRLSRRVEQQAGTLQELAEQNPELQPAISYLIGTLRHELLKHRIGAASQLLTTLAAQEQQPTEAQRQFLHQRLYGGVPLLVVWNEHLASFQRVLRPRRPLVSTDPDFVSAQRAILRLVRSERPLLLGQRGVLSQLAQSETEVLAFDQRLAELVQKMQRTVVDADLLREASTAVRNEHLAANVCLDEVLITPPPELIVVAIYRVDLLLVLKNLIRNAILAVGKSAPPHRIAVDVITELLPTGEELVKVRVHDTCPQSLPTERMVDPSSGAAFQRGLDLVRMTLRLYGGSLSTEDGLPGFCKCVVAQMFRVLDPEVAASEQTESNERVNHDA